MQKKFNKVMDENDYQDGREDYTGGELWEVNYDR